MRKYVTYSLGFTTLHQLLLIKLKHLYNFNLLISGFFHVFKDFHFLSQKHPKGDVMSSKKIILYFIHFITFHHIQGIMRGIRSKSKKYRYTQSLRKRLLVLSTELIKHRHRETFFNEAPYLV